ncbi:MAG: glycosyltransferase family 4 protein [Gammaproteobacteria bacterium]
MPAPVHAPAGISTIQVPRRFVTDSWGGTETTVLETSRALAAAGHPTRIFTSLALSAECRASLRGIEVRRFDYCYPFLGLDDAERADMDLKGGNLLSLELLRNLIREPGVDLLHAHSGKRLGGIVRTAALLRRIPYVVTLHGGVFDVPVSETNDLAAPTRGKLEWGKPLGLLLGSRRVLTDAAAVICVGRSEYDAARAMLPNQRVEFMSNGVDPGRFAEGDGAAFRRTLNIPSTAQVVLCLGRIDPQKNQLTLAQAFPSVLAAAPDAHLVLVGPVTRPAYAARIRAEIEAMGLAGRVHLVPPIGPDSQSLADAFHAADVFCLPSIHEPFGIVVLEAWAAGRPVVAARVGGIPGFVRDGSDALLVEPESPDSIAASIIGLLRDPARRQAIGEAGRVRAYSEFNWQSIGARMAALYGDVVGRRNR